MKRWIKHLLRSALQPVLVRFDRRMVTLVRTAILDPLLATENASRRTADEVDLVLNTVIRELIRLQAEVERLHQSFEDRQMAETHEQWPR
jgi:hypothetical protein